MGAGLHWLEQSERFYTNSGTQAPTSTQNLAHAHSTTCAVGKQSGKVGSVDYEHRSDLLASVYQYVVSHTGFLGGVYSLVQSGQQCGLSISPDPPEVRTDPMMIHPFNLFSPVSGRPVFTQ